MAEQHPIHELVGQKVKSAKPGERALTVTLTNGAKLELAGVGETGAIEGVLLAGGENADGTVVLSFGKGGKDDPHVYLAVAGGNFRLTRGKKK